MATSRHLDTCVTWENVRGIKEACVILIDRPRNWISHDPGVPLYATKSMDAQTFLSYRPRAITFWEVQVP